MRRKWFLMSLLALPLAIGGIVYAKATKTQPAKDGYTCPLTGEELPCPKCCPLNPKK
ncbi:MAG TPA: hypothetical protein VJZ71_05690 [Phycisphaerae bacterium]|nr:hypothetical protein [Phycisphaerae bacterium]